ncbi:hypothetical protein [Streptomyces sp. NBC_00557]|uniref:hypothetical protein n=1 Tax=Streptomyces sp. NBC_00557 TaxID=2975776 RepID=UPI002E8161CC|nr:hypothetical protein [Streptomyces sp. NBC_00557]WUC37210.1 hypothetical protein OG956_24850 [Streptomyces sp. NBC_00557]
MDGPIFGACALLSALTSALCLYVTLRRRHRPDYRLARSARTVASLSACIGSLLAIPIVADAVDRMTGCNELATLSSDLAAVVFCAGLQVMVVDWRHPRERINASVTKRVAALGAVVVLLIWEFQRIDRAHFDLSPVDGRDRQVTVYLLTYLAFSTVAALEVGTVSAFLARRTWLRGHASAVGLGICAAGAAFGLAYAVSRGGYLVAVHTGHTWPAYVESGISPVLAGLCIGGVTIGLSLATVSADADRRTSGRRS